MSDTRSSFSQTDEGLHNWLRSQYRPRAPRCGACSLLSVRSMSCYTQNIVVNKQFRYKCTHHESNTTVELIKFKLEILFTYFVMKEVQLFTSNLSFVLFNSVVYLLSCSFGFNFTGILFKLYWELSVQCLCFKDFSLCFQFAYRCPHVHNPGIVLCKPGILLINLEFLSINRDSRS